MAMTPEMSTPAGTHAEPHTTTQTTPQTMSQPVHEGSLPTPPPVVQQTPPTQQMPSVQQTPSVQHRNGSSPVPPTQAPYVQYAGSYGEPYVPYGGYRPQPAFQQHALSQQQLAAMNQQQLAAMSPQQLAALPRPVVPETKAWRITKDVLQVLSIVMSVVGLGLAFSMLSYGLWSDSAIITAASCPIFGIALVWSVAEELTRWARKWGPGIHPGAHVGVSLFLWLCCGIIGGLMAAALSVYGFDGYHNCGYYGDNAFCDERTDYTTRDRVIGVDVLLLLLWLVHFVVFVGACVDTSKRNAARRNPIVVVAQPPAYWGPAQQQWQQPMTQQGYPPQHAYAPQQAYHHQPQFQGVPVQPQATGQQGAPVHVQNGRNGKQPEMAQQPAAAEHDVREFYSPAGPGTAV